MQNELLKQKLEEIEKASKDKEWIKKKAIRQMQIEINIKDEINKRSTAFADKCKHDLKMVLAICRVPRLCIMF